MSCNRFLLRAAIQICEIYAGLGSEASRPLPEPAWRRLLDADRLLRYAQQRQWASQHPLLRLLRLRATEFQQAIDEFLRRLPDASQPQRPGLRAIYDDLQALHQEFDEVRAELREKQLVTTTPPITLSGVELGPFEIRLSWNRLRASQPYTIAALDPRPACSNDSVMHPHVQDQMLCEGEGGPAIHAALKQGRLLDFFLLVRQILGTYNGGSAFVSLSDWEGVNCGDCGAMVSADESRCCSRCSSELCDECSRSCGSCGETNCCTCNSACDDCGADSCLCCLRACSVCGASYCSGCLSNGPCQETEVKASEASNRNRETGSDASAELTVHAVCLGEAGVPT